MANLSDVIDRTQARIEGVQDAEPDTDELEVGEESSELDFEETDESDDDGEGDESESGEEEDSSEGAELDDELDAIVQGRVEAALAPLFGEIRDLKQTLTSTTTQQQNAAAEEDLRNRLLAVNKYLQTLPPDQRAVQEGRLRDAATALVIKQNNALRTERQQEIDARAEQETYENTAQFIAAGGRFVDGAYVLGHAPRLTDEEVATMKQFVARDGWTMEQWADTTLKARGARKAKSKALQRTLTKQQSATPRVKGTGSGNRKTGDKAETLGDVIGNLEAQMGAARRRQ